MRKVFPLLAITLLTILTSSQVWALHIPVDDDRYCGTVRVIKSISACSFCAKSPDSKYLEVKTELLDDSKAGGLPSFSSSTPTNLIIKLSGSHSTDLSPMNQKVVRLQESMIELLEDGANYCVVGIVQPLNSPDDLTSDGFDFNFISKAD